MSRVFPSFRVAAAVALAFSSGLAVAAAPAVLGKSRTGLWELDGIEGSKAPKRMCFTDLADLARLQHPARKCTQRAIRETDSSVTFDYQCSGSDFGQTKLDWVTSQSFRIHTQGISGGLPFAYKVQARRIGECPGRQIPTGR